jgi:hypothetical protein
MATKSKPSKSLASRGKYTGQLAEPIYEPIGGLLAKLMRPTAKERALEQQALKLQALFAWHGVDSTAPNAWTSLAIALALAHVPGMQVVHEFKRQRGWKKSWKAGLGVELVRDVEAQTAKHPSTTLKAIRALAKDKTKGWRVYTEQNLLTRHREARKAEQRRRLMAKQLMVHPTSPIMGGYSDSCPQKPTELDDVQISRRRNCPAQF